MRGDKVPLRDYVDQGLDGLARYHDATIGDLQDQIDRRLSEAQRETEGRFREQAAALHAAATAMDKRLDQMNEFREQTRDITASKVDAGLYTQTVQALSDRMEAIESVLDRQRGRVSAYTALGSVLLIAVALLTLVLNHTHL